MGVIQIKDCEHMINGVEHTHNQIRGFQDLGYESFSASYIKKGGKYSQNGISIQQ